MEKSFAPVLRIESIPSSICLTGNIQLSIDDIYCNIINKTKSQYQYHLVSVDKRGLINILLNSNQGVIFRHYVNNNELFLIEAEGYLPELEP